MTNTKIITVLMGIPRETPGPEYAGKLQGQLGFLDQDAAALAHELLWGNRNWTEMDWPRVCSALESAVSSAGARKVRPA